MPKILLTDTYYAEALDALHRGHPEWAALPYSAHLSGLLAASFGTSDFYSRNLAPLGWQVGDAVTNCEPLRRKWVVDHRALFKQDAPPVVDVALAQIRHERPDVLFLQDASLLGPSALRDLRREGVLLATQISCPMPPDECVRQMDVVFTSFPHYVERLRNLTGRRVEYSALAFDPDVLSRIGMAGGACGERDLPATFVGGVGADLHWRRGTELLEAVARRFPSDFHWWGYGLDRLAADSPLRACYRGEAWGLDMYRILARSRIVVNRHGEVAEGWANNMRLFEGAGMGACVLTESARNLEGLFPAGTVATCDSADTACAWISALLADEPRCARIAAASYMHVMEHHTYAQKMRQVDTVLREELAKPRRKA